MHGHPAATLVAATAMVLLTACGGSTAVRAAAGVLPAGAMSQLVPKPAEVPPGLILVDAQSGPADVGRLASFAPGRETATEARLRADGFLAAYIAEYASRGGRTLTVVVSRFATAAGAGRDLTPDLTGTTPVPGLADASGEQTQALPGGPAGGQLLTERFRVGGLTYLVAVGGPQGVDVAAARTVASQLAGRGRKA